MVRLLSFLIAVMLSAAALSACSGRMQQRADGQSAETPANSEAAQIDGQEYPGPADNQLTVQIESMEDEGSVFEYVVVTGLPEARIAESNYEGVDTAPDLLNQELETFFTWPMFSMDYPEDGKTVTVTAKYAVVGKYLSVRAYDTEYAENAAHPVSGLRSHTRDLETGEYAGWLLDFIDVDAGLAEAVTSGKFVQVYPETPIDGAAEELAAQLNNSEEIYEIAGNFYLTETGVGIYITGRTHAEGYYWAFEAPYDAIRPILSEKLLSAIE